MYALRTVGTGLVHGVQSWHVWGVENNSQKKPVMFTHTPINMVLSTTDAAHCLSVTFQKLLHVVVKCYWFLKRNMNTINSTVTNTVLYKLPTQQYNCYCYYIRLWNGHPSILVYISCTLQLQLNYISRVVCHCITHATRMSVFKLTLLTFSLIKNLNHITWLEPPQLYPE